MGTTNLDLEQKVFTEPSTAQPDGIVTSPNTLHCVAEKEPEAEFTYDTGLKTWLQVLGSFFLFFNSWYAFTKLIQTVSS
jgi:hypothetical protein